ncbi:MAG: hypothetical protein A4E53_02970 [Pelotomaculum sp. PtaB.Bin104]|nr:MAG: hypothetical protein A4E53_02970 [Pelotomaculum sp. PtaB.Bin104]
MIDCYMIEQTHSQVSLALRLTDDFTATGQPVGKISVFVKDHSFKAIKTSSGYYVFSDLPADVYRVMIQAEYYFDQEQEIDTGALELLHPVVNMTLSPNPGYPFPEGATLIRGMVFDQTEAGLPGVSAAASIFQPEPEVTARIGSPAPEAGDMSIRLINIKGSLQTGDYLVIKDANRSRTEFCQIATPLPANNSNPFNLTKPLKFKHSSNTPLNRVAVNDSVNTQTSEKGEYVIYFRTIKSDRFLTELTFNHPDYQTERREAEVCEGTLTVFGAIKLSPV